MPRCCGASLISAADGNGSPQCLGLQIQDGNPRNKTALAPGHSLMDWIRLGNSGVDLTGVSGIPRIVTLSELAKHNKQTDAWLAIRGVVFNVTRYMDFHPGGIDELMKGVGKDATKLFDDVHSWVNYQSILQKCIVGRLSHGSSSTSSITEKSITGMEVSRSYTPVPPCLHPEDMAPNYKSDCICLMIKHYPNGALTPSIIKLQPGQTLTMSNGLGAFVAESFDRYSVIHMLAGGTGLTAMLGIIQRALARRSVKLINLLNFNKDEDNMFYVKQLDKVSTQKFKVTHILSQAGDKWKGRRGVVSDELLKELIGECSAEGCVFTCGPKGFILIAKKCVQTLGWKSHQIHEFDD